MESVIIQAITFVSFVSYIIYRYGIPESISDSYYLLERRGTLFTIFCWILSVTMIYHGDEPTYPFLLSGVGLAFVGAATMFKWKGSGTDVVHYIGAVIGIVGAFIGIGYELSAIPGLVFLSIQCVIMISGMNNKIFWIEIVAFVLILASFVYKLLL